MECMVLRITLKELSVFICMAAQELGLHHGPRELRLYGVQG